MNEEITNTQINLSIIKETLINFIVPLVSLVVCIILGFAIIYPYYKNKDAVKLEIQTKIALNEVLSKKIALLNTLAGSKDVLDETTQIVDKVLVSEANVPQLLDEIYQIATGQGLEVTRLNYSFGGASATAGPGSREQVKADFEEVNVSLGANGSYDQLIGVIEDTEVAARILSIPSVRYTRDDEGKLSMNFTIVSPFLSVQSTAQTDIPVNLDIKSQSFVSMIERIKNLKYYEFLNKDIQIINEEAEEGEEETEADTVRESTPSARPTQPAL